MKHIFAPVVAATFLAGCFGAPPNEKILSDLCVDLFEGDSRSLTMIAGETGSDLPTFCSCFAKRTVAEATKVDLRKEILVTMTAIRAADNLDVEDTADRIEAQLDSGEITSFTENDFDDLGDYFQDLSMDMSDTSGVCPAS